MPRKHAYINAALKAANITRLQNNGFYPKNDEQDTKVSVFLDTLRALGFIEESTDRSSQYTFIKDDEAVTVDYRYADDCGYSSFWIHNVGK